MKRIRFITVVLAMLAGVAFGADEKPLKVCLVSASAEYGSHESLAKLQVDLEAKGVVCSRAFGEDKGKSLPGLEALADSDVMVLFTRRVVLPPEQLALVRKHIEDGKAVVGIRTASHGIQNWVPDVKAFDTEVLGGSYDGHYKNDEPAVLKPEMKEHAIFKGVQPFVTQGKLYKNPKLAEDVKVLLTAKNESGNTEPVVWIRKEDGGRVFYTSLGVQKDFEDANFRAMLVNAVMWAGKRE